MTIQVLQTAGKGSKGSKGRGRWLAGLVGGVALTAVVVAGIVTWQFASTTGSTETAVVTGGQAIQSSSVQATDTLGGVAERTQLQGYIVAPRTDAMGGMAEQAAIQRSLDSEVQANVMGGMAERTLLQAQLAAHLSQIEAEDWAAPRSLSANAAAPASLMGGVAERITIQGQPAVTADGGAWACNTSPHQTVC